MTRLYKWKLLGIRTAAPLNIWKTYFLLCIEPINVYNTENLKFLKLFAKIRIPSFPANGDIVFRMHTMYSLHGGDNLELGLDIFTN